MHAWYTVQYTSLFISCHTTHANTKTQVHTHCCFLSSCLLTSEMRLDFLDNKDFLSEHKCRREKVEQRFSNNHAISPLRQTTIKHFAIVLIKLCKMFWFKLSLHAAFYAHFESGMFFFWDLGKGSFAFLGYDLRMFLLVCTFPSTNRQNMLKRTAKNLEVDRIWDIPKAEVGRWWLAWWTFILFSMFKSKPVQGYGNFGNGCWSKQ